MKNLFATVAVLAIASQASAATFVIEDFDGGEDVRSSGMTSITPSTGSPSFSTSIFDVFGPTDRTINFDFADDSVSIFPGDTFGIVPETKTDTFFGEEDLDNADNPGGTGTATFEIDITGLTNLSVSALFSAMGDFEAGDNAHTFTYDIDSGTHSGTLFAIDADNADVYTYTMEDGITTNTLNDPLKITDDLGTRVIDNSFTTLGEAAIAGTGSLLTLTYTAAANNGGSEPFAFDDIVLTADESTPVVPEPTTFLIFAGLATVAGLKRVRG